MIVQVLVVLQTCTSWIRTGVDVFVVVDFVAILVHAMLGKCKDGRGAIRFKPTFGTSE